jgi:hypothetical protein
VAGYHDITDPANWATFDVGTLSSRWMGFEGAVFDGRYVYTIPHKNQNYTGIVGRYDTQGSFTDPASYSLFDSAVNQSGAVEFGGGAFDGRYLYMAPAMVQRPHAYVTRFDVQAGFGTSGAWTPFDTSTVNANAVSFAGAVFDGRYVYFVPDGGGANVDALVTRYDPQAPFTSATSWSIFDVTAAGATATGFVGGTFDGQYVYFAPFYGSPGRASVAARYDTHASFGDKASWSVFDVHAVAPNASGYARAVNDGRYVYLVPDGHGLVLRYDNQAPFGAAGSWAAFDTAPLAPQNVLYLSTGFDGRYVYFAHDGAFVLRYDSQAPFGAASSWTSFSIVSDKAVATTGMVFDGRFMYFIPGWDGGAIARFDARYPPLLPANYKGSFY